MELTHKVILIGTPLIIISLSLIIYAEGQIGPRDEKVFQFGRNAFNLVNSEGVHTQVENLPTITVQNWSRLPVLQQTRIITQMEALGWTLIN